MKIHLYFLIFPIFFFSCDILNNKKEINLAEESTAPFSKIDFKAGAIYVTLDDQEYQWLKLDTLDAVIIWSEFQDNFGANWQKRISEDMVEYLHKLSIYPRKNESFTLKNTEGQIKNLMVKFDRKKRDLAKQYFEATYDKDIDLDLLLFKQNAVDDLSQLEILIENKYSYYFLNKVDFKKEIQSLKEGLENQISVADFALRIGTLLNKFGDGHTRIHNVTFKEKGMLPFSVSLFNEKLICTKDGKLLNEAFPFLHSVNGVAVSRLLETSEKYLTPDASPQFKDRVRVSRLNRIGEILKINGSTETKLQVVLGSEVGDTTSFVQEMEEYMSRSNMSPAQKAEQLEEFKNYNPFKVKHYGKIGYLKIKSMEALRDDGPNFLPMNQLKSAEGLIIDVRDNGGGLRDILIGLAPHLISNEQGFVVGNVARLRTNTSSKNHDLSDRYLYQIKGDHYKEEVKLRLNNWMSNFSPSVSLPDSLYSDFYYLYIEGDQNPKFSDTPVVVLMNEGCYSATDIFLSTLKEINQVTLIGTASGGGSGRTKRYRLNNSRIELRLSSIVSFQPNGDLYDGVGVQPDIELKPNGLSDALKETDTQLDYALDFLRAAIK